MNIRTLLISLSTIALITACGGPGDNAEVPTALPAGATSADIGNHIVHFSAQSTQHLTPAIALEYNIVRSTTRAMLNVSVIRKSDNMPVEAEVSVQAGNLLGQLKNMLMDKKTEEPQGSATFLAIYYIGDTAVIDREILIFDISVKPDGEKTASKIRFKRQIYSD